MFKNNAMGPRRASRRRVPVLLAAAVVAVAMLVSCSEPAEEGSGTRLAGGALLTPTPSPIGTALPAAVPAPAPAAVAPGDSAPGPQTSSATSPEQRIPTRDGVVLTGAVVIPAGSGRFPLAVIPAAWGFQQSLFGAEAKALSARGYVVVTYNTRGFFTSGGLVDLAGPLDVADVSDVITWALAHTPADPQRIGVAGLSYGAGISLLAAGVDPRIKAVASLSGWTDFGGSLYDANTPHTGALSLLRELQKITGRSGPEFAELIANFSALRDIPAMLEWARPRSPDTYLPAYNANRTAIFLMSAFGDNYFSPVRQLTFFGSLTGPKTFLLAPGDHGTNEVTGLLGLPNAVWTSAWDWLDRFLRPTSATAATPPPAVLRLVTDGGVTETYPSWPGVTRLTTDLRLGPAGLGISDMSPAAATGGWPVTIQTGTDTIANAGVILLSGALRAVTKRPATIRLESVNRAHGAVWRGPLVTDTQRIRGIPALNVNVTPSAPTGTLVAYLYDTAPDGASALISKGVYSYVDAEANKPQPLSLSFDPVAHDLTFGHRLSLVVDTVDSFYRDRNVAGSTVTFTSPPDRPSALSVPIG